MNYIEIKELALSYADRQDAEVVDRIDGFLKIVESRVNRALRLGKMSKIACIDTIEDQNMYGLPYDFAGARDVEVGIIGNTTTTTLKYVSPEMMNLVADGQCNVYTIIADQIHVKTTLAVGSQLSITYYQKLPALTEAANTNWASVQYPDLYVFGLLVEISSFVKSVEGFQSWDSRFSQVLSEMIHEDAVDRWSGPQLLIRSM